MIPVGRHPAHGAAGEHPAATGPDATPHARRRPPGDDPSGARTRILDAAEALFATHGFDGTSTARIARAAGVPKGLLFYYFPVKGDILTTLLDERLGAPALDPTTLSVPGDPAQALLNIAERILSSHAASDVLREILWHESHVRAEVRDALTRYRRALHDAIEQVLAASLPAPADASARAAAASAWAASITARPLGMLRTDGRTTALYETDGLRQIARLLCAGLASMNTTAGTV